jgi:hypothetical protein
VRSHIASMGKVRHRSKKTLCDARRAWRVVDNFPADFPITAAELDAIEAFLMPLVKVIFSNEVTGATSAERCISSAPNRASDSEAPQNSVLEDS